MAKGGFYGTNVFSVGQPRRKKMSKEQEATNWKTKDEIDAARRLIAKALREDLERCNHTPEMLDLMASTLAKIR